MKSRPPKIQALMIRLPPSCIVRLLQDVCCDAREGRLAIVTLYSDDGSVGVRLSPDDETVHRGPEHYFEFVAPRGDLTSERVQELLA